MEVVQFVEEVTHIHQHTPQTLGDLFTKNYTSDEDKKQWKQHSPSSDHLWRDSESYAIR